MAMKKKPVTGMKDILPKEMAIRDYAIAYGGGGHMLASGCTLESKDLIMQLVEKIKRDLY
ncbi:hypothetical protein IJJ97_00985 [bacterium]|nr:hypothetical protein [bacterium]